MTDAQRDLVEANIQLAYKLIHKTPRPHQSTSVLDIEDIGQCAILGLIAAAKRFDPSRGWRFSTYAATRIRGAILDAYRAYDTLDRKHRLEMRAAGRTVAHEEVTELTQRVPEADDTLAPMKDNHVLSQSDVERIFGESVKRARKAGWAFGWGEAEIVRHSKWLAARLVARTEGRDMADADAEHLGGLGQRDRLVVELLGVEQDIEAAKAERGIDMLEARASKLRKELNRLAKSRPSPNLTGDLPAV